MADGVNSRAVPAAKVPGTKQSVNTDGCNNSSRKAGSNEDNDVDWVLVQESECVVDSSSSDTTVKGPQSQESKRGLKFAKKPNDEVEEVSRSLLNEVHRAPHIIDRGVIKTIMKVENTAVIRREDLEGNPLQIFDKEKKLDRHHSLTMNFLSDVATTMFKTLRDTKEMEEIYRRYQHQKMERGKDDHMCGVEIFFIVKGIQNPTATSHSSSGIPGRASNPVMIIAYRILVKTLQGNSKDVPKNSELESLEF